jgi:hypothetical protein
MVNPMLMKKIMLSLCVISITSALHGAVLTLNNHNPSPGQFTTFAAAEVAAAAGDTVLVHGTNLSYGTITVSKSLTIIGPGHRPITPGNLSAKFANITISINGVHISGVEVSGEISGSGVSDVSLTYVRCGSVLLLESCTNALVALCVIDEYIDLGNTGSGIAIKNSHITGGSFPLRNFGGSGNKALSNNILEGDGTHFMLAPGGLLNNTLLSNNIFYGLSPNSGTQSGCVYNNNLSFATPNNTLPPSGQSGTGNKVNINPQFVGAGTPSGFSYSRNYRLQTGSPGLGAGTLGTHIGVYEPSVDFSMTGEPGRPQTVSISATPSVPFGGTIQTNFTVRKSTPNAQ